MIILLIIAGALTGILFVRPGCMYIPPIVNLKSKNWKYWKYWKKVKRDNILFMTIGGLIGAILFPLLYML